MKKTLNLISQQPIAERGDVTPCAALERKGEKIKAQGAIYTLITPLQICVVHR